MKNEILLLAGIAPVILIGCHFAPCADVLIKKDTTVKSERENTLFAFIGEKIDVEHIPSKDVEFDNEFRAKYKVLQRVYGCYPGDTIEFMAYDHYGWPHFSTYKNVLLYLSESEGRYYHQKYQFDDVYMTRAGKWAGVYDVSNTQEYYELSIFPQKVDFVDKVSFPIYPSDNKGTAYRQDYPHPFYWTVGDSAIAQYGITIENLFKVKKEYVLKARGLFGKEGETSTIIPRDVELEEVPAPESEEWKVTAFGKKFTDWIARKDMAHIQQTLLDSLWVCGSLFTKQELLSGCFDEIFDSITVAELKNNKYVDYSLDKVTLKDLLPCARNRIVKENGAYGLKQLELFAYSNSDNVSPVYLSFIKSKKGYRLYDIRYPRNRSCCFEKK